MSAEHSCAVQQRAASTPHEPALVWQGTTWTRSQVDQRARRLQAALTSRGIHAGDRVVVLAENSVDLCCLHVALWRMRAVAVPLNARLSAPELAPLVERVRPSLVLADAPHLALVPRAENLQQMDAAPVENRPWSRPATDLHAVLFTSGTTGRAKGAMLTVGNFAAATTCHHANLGGGPDQHWLGTLPMFHVGGLCMMWRCFMLGCVLHLEERFDVARAHHALEHDGITHLSLVPTTLARLLELRGGRRFAPSVNAALVGGGPVSAEHVLQARRLGLLALPTWGMTETTSQACTQRPGATSTEACAPPLPGIHVRVVDAHDNPVAHGVHGHVEVRGPTVMAGYLEDDAATRAAFHDGWLRTGDLGFMDVDGALHILSRRTDLVLRGGENVYPAEVETALQQHPGVRECAVFPVDDAQWGQVPGAALVLGEGTTVAAVEADVATRLARFKRPVHWLVVEALPRNAMGKVDRGALRDLLARGGTARS